ncbi:MAG: hypothetical protein IPN85_14555 [Flavobacteriales bacterium]|nr:hypothetical protein [Flavobacteriales bacterium]
MLDFAKQLHPGALDLQFCEAQVLASSGRLNKALEVLDAIEQVEPFNEEIHLHKASIYSQLRNYRRAVDHYKRALGWPTRAWTRSTWTWPSSTRTWKSSTRPSAA